MCRREVVQMDKSTIEQIEKAMEDLELILNIIPDYVLGRRRGYTDKETETRANNAIGELYDILDKLIK